MKFALIVFIPLPDFRTKYLSNDEKITPDPPTESDMSDYRRSSTGRFNI